MNTFLITRFVMLIHAIVVTDAAPDILSSRRRLLLRLLAKDNRSESLIYFIIPFMTLNTLSCSCSCSLLGSTCLSLSLSLLLVGETLRAIPHHEQNTPSWQQYPQERRARFLLEFEDPFKCEKYGQRFKRIASQWGL